MRVIVCGSRRWTDRELIVERLERLKVESDSCTIVHGNAWGADRMAAEEAERLGFIVEEWDYRPFIGPEVPPRRAPLVRNSYMAFLGADLCIAFWDGNSTGTIDMMGKSLEKGIPVEEIRER